MDGSLGDRLRALHREIRDIPNLALLDRIAVVLHDSRSDHIHTFLESNNGPRPFERVSDRLTHHPALASLAETGTPWIDNAVGLSPERFGAGVNNRLVRQGYRSRYVVRLHRTDALYGFLFFNSRQPGFFTPPILAALRPYRRLIDVLVVNKLAIQRTMLAAIRTALQVSQYRDEETGAHLDRMSHYAELIAQRVAPSHGLSDEYVEFVYKYAPLHDIGKVSVPDNILLKPGKFTPDEFEIMKTHVTKGVEIVNAMVRNHGLQALPHKNLLLNMVGCHHENVDGTGYPNGLAGDAIPLEGRIVSVADVFDALTSKRPYKEAWTNDAAAAFLREQSGRKFAPACVDAFLADPQAIAGIQQRFQDAAD